MGKLSNLAWRVELATYYAIIAPEDQNSPSFMLLLSSTALILEILCQCRQDDGDLWSIVCALLDRGVAFHTSLLSHRQKCLATLPSSYRASLGYCPANYCPDFIDYLAYENHHDSFLHSQHGHTALMVGGILGCLAKDIVEYWQVYYGPSDEVFASGICLQSDRGDYSYWDNDLTTEEVDLLCGIYQVDTGQAKPPYHTIRHSCNNTPTGHGYIHEHWDLSHG